MFFYVLSGCRWSAPALATSARVRPRRSSLFALYERPFHGFFPLDAGVEVRCIPGNADVGLGVSNASSKRVRQRYFGRVNRSTLFEEWIPLRDGAIGFVKGLAAGAFCCGVTRRGLAAGPRGPVWSHPAAPHRVKGV
ncbi:hypothetical protein BC834DRAFT_973127 [Gloeopeniophorella convolvens]|nr:hypothetical protein BC834DRAFT_973127 [Gloeopeniophorella convolvens]